MSVSQTIERVWPCIMLRQTHDVDLTTGTIITLCASRVKPPRWPRCTRWRPAQCRPSTNQRIERSQPWTRAA